MIIVACTIHLYLPGVASLKEKRASLKPLLNQLRRKFEIAAAEVDHHDVWRSSDVALVTVTTEASHAYTVLENAVHWIEDTWPQVEVTGWETELR
ncbi:MAG: DUF503 domain-containing protein [Anaerolineae bacterium]|nr:DUF503 domain-containing protein [Anaerolineae bacterium]